jgi:nicotinate dehydrogenase subunit A
LQTAYIEEQVPQCGYCISGGEIKDALSGLKCRCGTHISILKAVKRAAEMMG